jgi:pimeloyl-ACP methyl ester carboxylesterase
MRTQRLTQSVGLALISSILAVASGGCSVQTPSAILGPGTVASAATVSDTNPCNPSPNCTAPEPADAKPQLPAHRPYGHFDLPDGRKAPWYMVPFDEQGHCQATKTTESIIQEIKSQGTSPFTDIFLFSHGWNNDWEDANNLYYCWITQYLEFHKANNGRRINPLFVGIVWPSTAFALPGEEPPGLGPHTFSGFVSEERNEISSLARSIKATVNAKTQNDLQQFYRLTQRGSSIPPYLKPGDVKTLANILASVFVNLVDSDLAPNPHVAPAFVANVDPSTAQTTAAQGFAQIWNAIGSSQPPSTSFDPTIAKGFISLMRDLDPRTIVRIATVWQMKDRAGVVGRGGVADLLGQLLNAGQSTKVHLVGHSFGAKVVLEALCSIPASRPVDSILLLEPAVSYACFDTNPVSDEPQLQGGYVDARNRVIQPILCTYSKRDIPLHDLFQFVVRRPKDLGEEHHPLVEGNDPPPKFAALGGYGPKLGATSVEKVRFVDASTRYTFPPAMRIIGIDCTPSGTDVIRTASSPPGIYGHGDIRNCETFWVLFNQISPP